MRQNPIRLAIGAMAFAAAAFNAMAEKQQALKLRNVIRHRKACRG